MLGNISKKKGDNGDFYTKPVIDKKLKDAETATKAYTDKAAADAKNDLYAEVGEKVGAVEETVKARLDSTDTKLDTKVDKVSGKGLVDETDIRTAVQSDNLTLADEKKITLRFTDSGGTGTNVIAASGMTVGYNNMKTTIDCGGASFRFTDTNENVFITPNDVTINQGGKTVHKLSSKANTSDVLTKANTAEFTPTADYQPATKKYVDDSVFSVGSGDMLKSVYDKDNDGIIDDVALLQYYGTTDITISDSSYFTVNETGETITGLTDAGKTRTELVIPYKINDVKITSIKNNAFRGCRSLKSITIPNSVTSIMEGAFSYNSALTSINIPNSVTSIMEGAFSYNSALTSINIPNSVTSIGNTTFAYCTALTSIIIPNSVTSIGSGAFAVCTGLTSINIPNGVTSIGDSAFNNCTSLTSINIPNSVTSIGDTAFAICTNLTIYCEQGSYAETFAKDNNISVVYTDIKDDVLHKLSEKVNVSDVGALSTLATTNKSSIVAAINELKAAIDEIKGS